MIRLLSLLTAALLAAPAVTPTGAPVQSTAFDIRSFGARGDGQAIDWTPSTKRSTPPRQPAGLVDLPAGQYRTSLSGSGAASHCDSARAR